MKNKYINPFTIEVLSIILTLSTLLYMCINKVNNNNDDIAVSAIHQTETALVIHLQDNTSITISKLQLENEGFINLDDIVDWNTGKEEIAISLKNGYECYATKSQDIYTPKFKSYVAFDEIFSVREIETGFEIVTKDGNVYTFDK